jgi:hypothetical protein
VHPKRRLLPITNGDGGIRIEYAHVFLGTRVAMTDPKKIGVRTFEPRPTKAKRRSAFVQVFYPKAAKLRVGRQTIFQLTLHFAPVVVSLADQRKTLSILLMNLMVSGGIV